MIKIFRMRVVLLWLGLIRANLLDPSKKGKKEKESNKFVNVEKTIERYYTRILSQKITSIKVVS